MALGPYAQPPLPPGIFPGGKGGRCVGLTTLPPSCADCLKIWEPQPPGTLRACNGIVLPIRFNYKEHNNSLQILQLLSRYTSQSLNTSRAAYFALDEKKSHTMP